MRAGSYFVFVGDSDTPADHAAPASTPNPAGPLALVAADDAAPAIGFVPDGETIGTVSSAPSGTPTLPDVFVSLYLDDGDGVFEPGSDAVASSTLSGADGRYAFRSLLAGEFWVVPGPPPVGYLAASPVATPVTPGATVVTDLRFAAAGSIAGR